MSDVVVISWPEDRENALQLSAVGVPLLYLVGTEDDPPQPTGCLEDWVRLPGDERDLRARLKALEIRAALHHGPPFVDGHDHLHHRGQIVVLTPVEARLARLFTARLGAVVPDHELLDALRREPAPATSLRAEVAHLRARLRVAHLAIKRARRRGYVMVDVQ